MAKQEIFDAINATIAPNNIKGITADSLRNVLTLMADNAGSGSGEGALRVMIPTDLFETGVNEMDFTPEYWEQIKVEMDMSLPGLSATLDPIVEEIFRHNAEVYTLLMEKAAKNEGVMCLLDMSAWVKEMMGAIAMTEGVALSFNAFSASVPSTAMIIETGPAEMAAEMAMPTGVTIMPLSNGSNGIGIQSFTAVELRADGTVRMYIDAYDIDYVYVPENDEGVLSDNQKATNALWKQQGLVETITEVRMCFSATGSDSYSPGPRAVYVQNGEVHYLQYDKTTGITYLKQATIADDGSATVTILGTLNSPTA